MLVSLYVISEVIIEIEKRRERGENDANIIFEVLNNELPEGFAPLRPEEVGALTDSPIIGYDIERDEQGNPLGADRIFWYPDYQINNELDELLKGTVTFTEA